MSMSINCIVTVDTLTWTMSYVSDPNVRSPVTVTSNFMTLNSAWLTQDADSVHPGNAYAVLECFVKHASKRRSFGSAHRL